PSITMILFAEAAEKSLGRLFLAGIGPALLLVTLFGGYAVIRFRREYAAAEAAYKEAVPHAAILARDELTLAERLRVLPPLRRLALSPAVDTFVVRLSGGVIAPYDGYATASEMAGLGGPMAVALIAVIYGVWRPSDLGAIMKSTIRESTMLTMIIGMALLYSDV